jgi:hypothetical protein
LAVTAFLKIPYKITHAASEKAAQAARDKPAEIATCSRAASQ